MLNKKILTCILLLLIVGICAISAVSATDDVADVAAANEANDDLAIDDVADDVAADEASDDLAIDEATADEVTTYSEQDSDDTLQATNEDEILSVEESDEVLSSSSYSLYSVYLQDSYQISSYSQGKITGTVSPPPSYMPGYYFYLGVFDSNGKVVYADAFDGGYATSFSFTIPAKTLLPGKYTLKAVNDYDSHIMDTAVLIVSGAAVITGNNYNANYMSSTPMTAKITDKNTKKPLTSLSVKAVFTKGKTSVTKYYKPNSNGVISFIPPVGVGTWSVRFTPADSRISGSAVKTATLKKSGVSISVKKVVEYKGFKPTIKAFVKSNGKNVNEGKVQFKINGKKYMVPVKNGVATLKVKLKKVKKYPYTAQYFGTNLFNSKKVKSKVVMKKRLATKIVAKNQKVNTAQSKYFYVKVLTKNGKKVSGGKLKIVGVKTPQPVKKGKAKLVKYGTVSMLFKGSNGYIYKYKKSLTKKYKLKYTPDSHKYKPSSKKIKLTVTYKCPICGLKSTHYHYHNGYYSGYGYYYGYTTKMVIY